MSDATSFDINITLSDAAPGWQPHLMPALLPHRVDSCCAVAGEVSSHDEFDLDIRYGGIVGDPPASDAPLLAGFLSITCGNTCGVGSGCAGSGCGGVTCGNSCNVFSGCATACGTCGASCGCPSAGGTCNGTCDSCDCGGDGGGGGDGW